MFDKIKEWLLKKGIQTWARKFISNGLIIVSTWLLSSDYGICQATDICQVIAAWLGENAEAVVGRVVEVLMFAVGALLSIKGAKAETAGREVLKGK